MSDADGVGRRRPRSDPYQRHRFVVEAEGLPELGVAEVRGLEVSVERRAAADAGGPDGGGDRGPDRRPLGELLGRITGEDRPAARSGRERETTSPTLELRRGVGDDLALWTWLRDWTGGTVEPRSVGVYLLDGRGEPAVGWVCTAATPTGWSGPDLRAGEPGVAMETLELAHEGLRAASDPPAAVDG